MGNIFTPNYELLGQEVKKKQLGEMLPVDTTKKGGAWQTELRKAETFGEFEIIGKGAGTRYIVHEIYEIPKERIHGNTGREPINKGQVDEDSLKYKLALALVTNFAVEDETYAPHQPKRYYLDLLGCHLHNFKHVENMFWDRDLDHIDNIVLKLANNTSKSLNGRFQGALDLINKGVFPGIRLDEQLYYATFDHEHYEVWDEYELYDLYNDAKEKAKATVKAEHGDILFFSEKRHLENEEYQVLITSDEKYKPLFDNKIDYFYSRYAFIGKLEKQDSAAYDYEALNYDGSDLVDEYEESRFTAEEFVDAFQEHRLERSLGLVNKHIEIGIAGIVDTDELPSFATNFAMMLFDMNEYQTFAMRFNKLMENVRKIKNTGFEIAS